MKLSVSGVTMQWFNSGHLPKTLTFCDPHLVQTLFQKKISVQNYLKQLLKKTKLGAEANVFPSTDAVS